MSEFNANLEAQALVRMAESYSDTIKAPGGSSSASALMSDVQDEWCKATRNSPERIQPIIVAIEATNPQPMGRFTHNWKGITNGSGEVVGIVKDYARSLSSGDSLAEFLPLKCRF